MSIFNLRQRFYEEYDTIYLDIDGKKGDTPEAFAKLKSVYSKFPYISRCYYSGVGYHLFIDLIVNIKGMRSYKNYVRELVRKYKLEEFLDSSCIGDYSRVARVPNSINSKSGNKMILIDLNSIANSSSHEQLLKGKIGVSRKFTFEELGLSPKDILVTETKSVQKASVSWEEKYGKNYPPCITNSINFLMEEGELNHNERLHLATFLINIGREDELREALKFANDYSEKITDYQIEYLKSREMVSFSCDRVEDDICSYVGRKKLCPFYPSVNVSIRRLSNEIK